MTPGFFFLTGFIFGGAVVAAAAVAAVWTFANTPFQPTSPAAPPSDDRGCVEDNLYPATVERLKREAIQERARRNPANRTMFDS